MVTTKEAQSVSTVSDQRRAPLPTTIADTAAEAGRSTASFYSHYDSKESMVREWALRFHDEVSERAKPVTQHGLSSRERAYRAAAAHWHTYKHLLAEMISVSQLAMVSEDFARYGAEICSVPTSFITEMVRRAQAEGCCAGDDPQLVAVAIVAMLNQFCYLQLVGPSRPASPMTTPAWRRWPTSSTEPSTTRKAAE
jgi:AcrR family transcriptional regulator